MFSVLRYLFGCFALCLSVLAIGQTSTNTANTLEFNGASACGYPANGAATITFQYVNELTGVVTTSPAPVAATVTNKTPGPGIDVSAPGADFPYFDPLVDGSFNFFGGSYWGGSTPHGSPDATITITQGGSSRSYRIYYDYIDCLALPVTLNSFSGSISGCSVSLAWSTTMESNSSRFEIERTSFGSTITYMKIGTVTAAGTSSSLINYSFTDNYPNNGSNFYRLRMVDIDGRYKYSSTVTASTPGCTTQPPAINCSSINVVGPDFFCQYGQTYTLSSVPDYRTVTWTVTPTSVANWGKQVMEKAMIRKTGNGVVTLTANLTGCTGTTGVRTKRITVGNPSSVQVFIDTIAKHTYETRYRLEADQIPGATYQWFKNNVAQGTGYATFTEVPPGPCQSWKVVVTLPCGNTIQQTVTICYKSPGGIRDRALQVDPVPAGSTMNVQLFYVDNPSKSIGQSVIEIQDLHGKIYKRVLLTGLESKQQLDISTIPPGLYVIQVTNGKDIFAREIQIAR
ncbi:MAG: T9SS type A sorting domain-containing protein [Chitinophagaceae bacterium]